MKYINSLAIKHVILVKNQSGDIFMEWYIKNGSSIFEYLDQGPLFGGRDQLIRTQPGDGYSMLLSHERIEGQDDFKFDNAVFLSAILAPYSGSEKGLPPEAGLHAFLHESLLYNIAREDFFASLKRGIDERQAAAPTNDISTSLASNIERYTELHPELRESSQLKERINQIKALKFEVKTEISSISQLAESIEGLGGTPTSNPSQGYFAKFGAPILNSGEITLTNEQAKLIFNEGLRVASSNQPEQNKLNPAIWASISGKLPTGDLESAFSIIRENDMGRRAYSEGNEEYFNHHAEAMFAGIISELGQREDVDVRVELQILNFANELPTYTSISSAVDIAEKSIQDRLVEQSYGRKVNAPNTLEQAQILAAAVHYFENSPSESGMKSIFSDETVSAYLDGLISFKNGEFDPSELHWSNLLQDLNPSIPSDQISAVSEQATRLAASNGFDKSPAYTSGLLAPVTLKELASVGLDTINRKSMEHLVASGVFGAKLDVLDKLVHSDYVVDSHHVRSLTSEPDIDLENVLYTYQIINNEARHRDPRINQELVQDYEVIRSSTPNTPGQHNYSVDGNQLIATSEQFKAHVSNLIQDKKEALENTQEVSKELAKALSLKF